MTQITLVLPFALPLPELAPDLVRALNAPALASLLTRTSTHAVLPYDDTARALPHESWLANTLSLSSTGRPAFAAAAMRGLGVADAQGTWFIVNPAHIEIERSHLAMTDLRRLGLSDADSRALFATAEPIVRDSGRSLVYGDADTWFLRADDWQNLVTTTPDCAIGLNLTDWLPKGAQAGEFRKLQNDIQMMWFEHPTNVAREARGLASVNCFWPWGLADGTTKDDSTARLAVYDAPSWLTALAHKPVPALGELLAGGADALLACDLLSEAAIGGEWSLWLQHMHWLEESLFVPALAAVRDGRIARLRLILSHRNTHIEFTTGKLAQYAFWRRPTLNRLLP